MQIGPYEVLGELARGGMGAVYRARDPALDREVAIKVILSADADELPAARALQRFEREARAASRVRHANVVAVHGLGQHQGRPYLVMDLVEGESLMRRVQRGGPLPPQDAARLTAKLARALEAAHAQGVLHRDVKPENVLVTPAGEPVLVDFGLARLIDARTRATRTGEVMGTARTMPPEQAEGDPSRVGPRSDVYSLGATLYELLSGRPVFQAPTLLQVLNLVLHQPPPPLREHAPGIDRGLEAICLRCLEKRPEDRWGSAADLARALEDWVRAQEGELVVARPAAPLGWVAPVLAIAGAGLAVVVLLLGLALRGARGERDQLRGERDQLRGERDQLRGELERLRAERERPGTGPAGRGADPGSGPASPAELEYQRGAALHTAGREAEALAAYDRALELDPRLLEARLRRAHLRYRADDLDGAEADAAVAIELAPDESRGWFWRGAARLGGGKAAEALGDLQRAIGLRPVLPEAFLHLGKARGMMNDAAGAEAALDEALRLDPRLGEAWGHRATLRADRQDWKGARADAEKAIELAPTSEQTWQVSALVAFNGERDAARAVRDATRAIEVSRKPNAVMYLLRGTARAALGQAAAGREDLLQARQLCPAGGPYEQLRATIEERLARLPP